jgi:hypothetical protein
VSSKFLDSFPLECSTPGVKMALQHMMASVHMQVTEACQVGSRLMRGVGGWAGFFCAGGALVGGCGGVAGGWVRHAGESPPLDGNSKAQQLSNCAFEFPAANRRRRFPGCHEPLQSHPVIPLPACPAGVL